MTGIMKGDVVINVESSIRQKMESLPKQIPNSCFYKVPDHIRKINRDCYRPSIVSIGPIYYKFESLKRSRELKLRHLDGFLRFGSYLFGDQAYTLGDYISIVRHWENYTRSFYEEKIELSSSEFVEMILVDAAFIIYLFIRCSDDRLIPIDPMKEKVAWMVKIEQDLFLQDNQLPFHVLNNLYEIAFGKAYGISFKDLTCKYIAQTYNHIPGKVAASNGSHHHHSFKGKTSVKNLVDFLRLCCLPPNGRKDSNQDQEKEEKRLCCLLPFEHFYHQRKIKEFFFEFRRRLLCCSPLKPPQLENNSNNNNNHSTEPEFPPSAKELKAAGVRFEAIGSEKLLDIRYANGVLQIPTLTIQDTTEGILRSIVFYEQCHYFQDSYFIDYVFFLDALIDTAEDAEILVKHGIIKHWLGSDKEVATMVNRMTTYIMIHPSKFYYSDITRKLIAHANARCNKWTAVLRRDYFRHPWSILSVVYLSILLILTILQVYTGFKQ